MKKVIFCHGDKGGIGKTIFAGALVDLCLQSGPVTLVEGDIKIGDAAARYRDVEGISGLMIDLARPDSSEDAAIRLFESIERAGVPAQIVINLPASASSTVDLQSDVIKSSCVELGYDLRVAWLIGPGEESARLAMSSALCHAADRRIAIVNSALGDPSKSAWQRSDARQAWLSAGGLESVMPALASRVMNEIRDRPGRYSTLAAPQSGLSVISRQVIKNWLTAIADGPGRLMLTEGDEQ